MAASTERLSSSGTGTPSPLVAAPREACALTSRWWADESKVTLQLLIEESRTRCLVNGAFGLGVCLVFHKCIALVVAKVGLKLNSGSCLARDPIDSL